MNIKPVMALGACVAFFACTAPAQDDVLRGPSVSEHERKTLVSHSMTGQFRRVEGSPVEAALVLLDLDEPTRASATGVVDERAVSLTVLLVDEIDTVRAITDAMAGQRSDEARALLEGVHERFDGAKGRDPLLDDLKGVLSEEEHAELAGIVDEYWRAWVDATAGGRELDARERAEAEERLAFALFQQEVRGAYDVSLRRYREVLEGIYERVEASDDEREAIRTIVIEFIKETRLKPTAEERRTAMVEIYRALDEPKRERFFEYVLLVAVPDPG